MTDIKIGKQRYKVKNTVRSLFIFEKITGRAFAINSLIDNYLYFYSILLASNPDMTMTWDEFIDAIDSDPKVLEDISGMLAKINSVDEVYTKAEDADKEDTSKKG